MSDLENLFFAQLNSNQYEAINCTEGPLLILAGAGTGKTKVLTSRIAHIINSKLAEPYNILAVTFTNKAAKEMSERITNMIPAQGLNIGTFHSIATRILRSHISYLNKSLSSNFIIIDQDDQVRLIKNISAQLVIDIKIHPPKMICAIISRWKDLGLLPHELTEDYLSSPSKKIAKTIYLEYQQQLEISNVVDFGDLLVYNNELLLKNPHLLHYYQNKFKYILIDEYQDTNTVQYNWARMLAGHFKNICCVGDDDQSIYSWRGAEVTNILRFENDFPNAKIIKLEQNYRSSSQILTAASNLISHNKHRHSKVLWTDKVEGEKIKIVSCWNDKEEARFIVAEIEKTLIGGIYSGSQIAILVRAGFQTRAFEEVFISNAIPYKIIGGLRFYERMEIRDVLAYIRIAVNKNDNLALERIINVPKRSVGSATLRLLKEQATQSSVSILEATRHMINLKLLKGKAAENLKKLIDQIDRWHEMYKSTAAFEVTQHILEDSGYLSALKQEKTEDIRGRIENINEMLRAIEEFANIEEFVQHTSLVMENDFLRSDSKGIVNIMTLHAAKGLEFAMVFLPGWEEGIFPHQKSITEEGEKGLEEERRIAYVGITRAKKDLYITFAESRWMFNEVLNSIPSRFLAEIPDEVCIKMSSAKISNQYSLRRNFSSEKNIALSALPTAYKNDEKTIRPGSRVSHEKFGAGIVTRRDGDKLEIVFKQEGSIKTIKDSYVKLL
ncbi:MAG: ATP-dependent DNA helicase PcrA [Rickettsiaceae bacterium]|nr:MAG: ATP-dependent DNA helicase PcrA [Rickettsiaceae bacterium]